MLKRIIAVLLFAIAFILVFPSACNNPESVEKETGMINGAGIPPIDTYAPAVTETATFALG